MFVVQLFVQNHFNNLTLTITLRRAVNILSVQVLKSRKGPFSLVKENVATCQSLSAQRQFTVGELT